MKRKFFTSLVTFQILLFSVCAAPKIGVQGEATFDFGKHQSNQKKEAVFTIKNAGDGTLEIKSVNKTCGGCVEIGVSEKEILPAKTAEIRVALVPGTLSGPYTKNFFVETNDPAQKFTMFTFKGTAVPVAEIKPSNLMYIGRIELGTYCKREFLVVPLEKGTEFGEPLSECNYQVKITSSKSEKGLGVIFEFTPDKNAGDMKCKIKIPVLKPEGWPSLEIIVSASIAGTAPEPAPAAPAINKDEKALSGKTQEITVIEYFHQAGCADCRMIGTFIIPKIEESFKGKFKIEKYDTAIMDSFLRFAFSRDRLNIQGNETVCMIVNGKHAFNGYKNIDDGLLKQIGDSIRMNEKPDDSFSSKSSNEKDEILRKHAENITMGALIAAGLIDGINPCVFSTLVFFMSVLAVSGIKGRKLLLFGSLYCLSCFLTYFLLGLGILRFIKLFSGYEIMQVALNRGMFALLLVFAILSFRDAWLYRRTGEAGDILLQLPESMKKRIHKVIREGTHFKHLATGAVITGFLVTLLESVCTGQVYLPALALMTKQDPSSLRWIFYLVLYNVMFIIPLLVIFAAAYAGTGILTMMKWSKRDVVIGKILLGILFIGLAVLMILF